VSENEILSFRRFFVNVTGRIEKFKRGILLISEEILLDFPFSLEVCLVLIVRALLLKLQFWSIRNVLMLFKYRRIGFFESSLKIC